MRQLLTMTATDLRQRVRDKSVLIFGILVPIALMSVMNMVFQTEDVSLDPVTVAASAAEDDELGQAVLGVLSEFPELEVTVEEVRRLPGDVRHQRGPPRSWSAPSRRAWLMTQAAR